nr:MAG TPA: hypothetical protein [Caudoviricetes sp.]
MSCRTESKRKSWHLTWPRQSCTERIRKYS